MGLLVLTSSGWSCSAFRALALVADWWLLVYPIHSPSSGVLWGARGVTVVVLSSDVSTRLSWSLTRSCAQRASLSSISPLSTSSPAASQWLMAIPQPSPLDCVSCSVRIGCMVCALVSSTRSFRSLLGPIQSYSALSTTSPLSGLPSTTFGSPCTSKTHPGPVS